MSKTPEERLARLAGHAREGWRLVGTQPEARARAQRWLAEHPSARADVDRLWRECLDGRGPLADWLAAGGEPASWPGSPPLHSILASHPFPDLPRWSIPRTSAAS
jgi:hypothetical protein